MSSLKYLIQFSGGVGSFAAACWAVSQHGRDNVELLFADTMMEDEDLYRFVDDCVNYLKVPLHVVKDGRDPWQVFNDVKFLGNSRVDPCSRILKRELCKGWVKNNYPDVSSVRIVLGIDWTEEHRVKNFVRWWNPYTGIAPLVEDKTYDKNKFMHKMQTSFGIKIPRLYTLGFPHNNCGGFCVKAGKAHFLHLLSTLPDRYRYHEERERVAGAAWKTLYHTTRTGR